ncbi:MAG: hypothetical protein FWD36_04905 [Treponema sp.]|nr:hypothetical protein [Treponema sp.]
MKKLLLIMVMGLLVGTAAFADHPEDKLALGFLGNFGWGHFGHYDGCNCGLDQGHYTHNIQAGYFYPGISIKLPGLPVFFGALVNLRTHRPKDLPALPNAPVFSPANPADPTAEETAAHNKAVDEYNTRKNRRGELEEYTNFGIGVLADYYIFDKTFFTKRVTNEEGAYYDMKMCWYLGAGAFIDLDFSTEWQMFTLGIRMPAGISWHIIPQIETYLGIAPRIGASSTNANWDLHGSANFEFGLRFWF